MKRGVKFVSLVLAALLLFNYCGDSRDAKCRYHFNANSIIVYSADTLIDANCVQRGRFNLSRDEFGEWIGDIQDAWVYSDGERFFYWQPNSHEKEKKVFKQFFSITTDGANSFKRGGDTIYKVFVDAKFPDTQGQINACLFFDKQHGIVGLYINDMSDYILGRYKRNVVRSIRGITDVENIDTTKTLVFRNEGKVKIFK